MQVTEPWQFNYASTAFSSTWMNDQQAMRFRLDGWGRYTSIHNIARSSCFTPCLLFWRGADITLADGEGGREAANQQLCPPLRAVFVWASRTLEVYG
jgi:hypothetical protein